MSTLNVTKLLPMLRFAQSFNNFSTVYSKFATALGILAKAVAQDKLQQKHKLKVDASSRRITLHVTVCLVRLITVAVNTIHVWAVHHFT